MALIPFYKPTIRRKDMDAVLQTMVDERIGPGERAQEFLKQFCSDNGAINWESLVQFNSSIK